MIQVEISERLYRYIQQHAVPFEDSVDTVLTRMLGLDQSETSPSATSTDEAHGALAPLIEAGLIEVGDELRWHRAKKNVTYMATVGPQGSIVLDNGTVATSPSGAAVAVAGGNHPGWDVWQHVSSGLPLSELRAQLDISGRISVSEEVQWKPQVEQVLSRLPLGTWTSYGDLGRLLGRHPRELGHYLSTTKASNAHRVLQHNGKISPSFQWVGEDRGDVRELLRKEGVLPDSGDVAPSEKRLHVQDLRLLLES